MAGDAPPIDNAERDANHVPVRTTLTARIGSAATGLRRPGRTRDFALAAFAPLLSAAVTLWLVIPTLAPGVASWDTAEFQTVGPVMGTAHPTGYPAYVVLGWIASCLLQPFGEPAFRMNLLQAILAAGAVAGAVAIVQFLTGMRWIALATGLLLAWTQLFWRLSTHADPHMFHLTLVAFLFLLLLVWERRRTGGEPETGRRADRWLVAAACVYGIAVTNHSLALLLPPAIALFVLAVAPRILLHWRLVLTCVAVLAATIVVFLLELPIRAAMHAPLVYGNPDTWSGFAYIILAQQFGGSLVDPWGDLGTKAGAVMDLISGWLGPLGYFAAVGFGTSLVRRPRYILLSGLAAVAACWFASSYANADIERYYLVPLFVAFTWIGLGLADLVSLAVWFAAAIQSRVAHLAEVRAPAPAPAPALAPTLAPTGRLQGHAMLAAEAVIAVTLLAASAAIVPERQHVPDGDHPTGVSEADRTDYETWMRTVLASADQGGLPDGSVIVSWWDQSTTLWYGQKVDGLRPDILIVDDSNIVNDNLVEVRNVIDRYLGQRPVLLLRLPGDSSRDGVDALRAEYQIVSYPLPNGVSIDQVVARLSG